MQSEVEERFLAGLPTSLAMTTLVVGLPVGLILVLRLESYPASPLVGLLAGMSISLVVSLGAAAVWKRRRNASELTFQDLMIWGWLRRWHFTRVVSRAGSLTRPDRMADLSRAERTKRLEHLARALEARDAHTYGHSKRVSRHVVAIARGLSLAPRKVAKLRIAALLHDVGKVEIPRAILGKPDKLTDAEYEVVKRHASVGAKMVSSLQDPELTSIVRHHHERLDGGGYPDGLAGDRIPLGSRIIAVADTFDAVTSGRAYRSALSHQDALALLSAESGKQLDPLAVRAFHAQYSGHRGTALLAGLAVELRQVGQSLLGWIGGGVGATPVAAAAATAALGAAALHPRPAPDPASAGPVASRTVQAEVHPGAGHARGAAAVAWGGTARRGAGTSNSTSLGRSGRAPDQVAGGTEEPTTPTTAGGGSSPGSDPSGSQTGGGGRATSSPLPQVPELSPPPPAVKIPSPPVEVPTPPVKVRAPKIPGVKQIGTAASG